MEQDIKTDQPGSSVPKRILKVFLYLLGICLLLAGSLVALLFIYENEVKAAVLRELNKRLKAEVRIDPANINLTIIKTFPDCSVEFRDVLMLEALPVKKRDTLLYAAELNLYFNIKDLWNKKYRISRMRLKDALAKPVIFKNGKNNYTFWDAGGPSQPGDSIRFDLQQLEAENCRLLFRNKQSFIKTQATVKTLQLDGSFGQSDYGIHASGKVAIDQVTQNKSTIISGKTLAFSVELAVSGNTYRLGKTNISLNQLGLTLEGGFVYKDSLQSAGLMYSAPDLDIAAVLSLLPPSYKEKTKDYASEGNFYASGKLNYQGPGNFLVESKFGIRKGTVVYKPQSTEASNINVEGSLKYSNSFSRLELDNIYLELNNDRLEGSCAIRNFSDPHLKFSAGVTLDLQNLQNFWPIDTLSSLKGKLSLTAEGEGLLSDLRSRAFSDKVSLRLDAAVSELEAQFRGDAKVYAVENCSFTAKEREVEVHDLKMKRGGSDLKVNGKIPGLFNYLADRKAPLIISGNLFSEHIDLGDFVAEAANPGQPNDNPLIPENIEFRLNAAILQFSFGKFTAQNITGDIEVKEQKAVINNVKLETMEGEADISAYADNSKGRLEVVLQSRLRNININHLFSGFNNFGQATLKDENLKGFATADVDFSGTWNNRLECDLNSLKASCDLEINKGELIDFKPLLSLSNYVDIKDLQHIRFSSLKSPVEIKNSTIYLPKTSVKNSALNIELWGTHTFDNNVDYHIRLLINDYLAGKRKKKDDEFGPVENDPDNRRSAFVLMTGNIDNPVIKYDRKGLKEKIKGDIKQEKQTIRQILKEELNVFKGDSVKKSHRKQERVFEIEKPTAPSKKNEAKKKEEDEEDF